MSKAVAFKKGLTYEEKKLAEFMEYNSLGSFYTHFWKAVVAADLSNLSKLQKGFPGEVAAWERYMDEGHFWRKQND